MKIGKSLPQATLPYDASNRVPVIIEQNETVTSNHQPQSHQTVMELMLKNLSEGRSHVNPRLGHLLIRLKRIKLLL